MEHYVINPPKNGGPTYSATPEFKEKGDMELKVKVTLHDQIYVELKRNKYAPKIYCWQNGSIGVSDEIACV